MIKAVLLGFDWDEGNAAKCENHGLSREEIEAFFAGNVSILYDFKHSAAEERYIAVGYGPDGRPMLSVFSLRTCGKGVLIRPISARFMHSKEAKKYEKTHPKTKK